MRHTPGPWLRCKTTIYKDPTGNYEWIATTSRSIGGMPENQELEEANANLIAAAPEMLEALEHVMQKLLQERQEVWEHEIAHLAHAIYKAKGETK
jgi:hypothetical protein